MIGALATGTGGEARGHGLQRGYSSAQRGPYDDVAGRRGIDSNRRRTCRRGGQAPPRCSADEPRARRRAPPRARAQPVRRTRLDETLHRWRPGQLRVRSSSGWASPEIERLGSNGNFRCTAAMMRKSLNKVHSSRVIRLLHDWSKNWSGTPGASQFGTCED